jgi:long-chain acyl-CoA synthetase
VEYSLLDRNEKTHCQKATLQVKMGLVFNTVAWLIFGIILPFLYLKSKIGRVLTIDHAHGKDREGPTKRSYMLDHSKELATSPTASIKNLYDVLLYGARVYPESKHIFGSREFITTHKESKVIHKTVNGAEVEGKKEWSFLELGAYSWLTYRDVVQITTDIGAGLVKIGLKQKDIVTIFASTRQEWMLMAYGCYAQGITISTSYDNLGVDALVYSLNECETTTLFTQSDLFSVVEKIGNRVPTLKNIIYCGKVDQNILSQVKEAAQFQFLSLDELKALGHQHPVPFNPPTPEDLCCIMYTSGSTGNPKGVMLTHANMIASVAGGDANFSLIFDGTDESYLGYLPLAHVLEFLIENYCVFKGIKIGYGSPRTLTDAMVRNCKGDMRELGPTVFAGVPAVWETIKKGIMAKLEGLSPTKQAIFMGAVQLKQLLIRHAIPTALLDKLVFQTVLDQVGGRLKAGISGGAPIAAETQEFMTAVLCPIVQGYDFLI